MRGGWAWVGDELEATFRSQKRQRKPALWLRHHFAPLVPLGVIRIPPAVSAKLDLLSSIQEISRPWKTSGGRCERSAGKEKRELGERP